MPPAPPTPSGDGRLEPPVRSAPERVANTFQGHASGVVVQAGTIHGGVHHNVRGPATELDLAAEELAGQVRAQWTEQARERGVRDPVPLRVRWSLTRRPVAASPSLVLYPDGSRQDGAEDADELRRRVQGEAARIAEVYGSLPSGQLVVIGEPGAGKSSLLMLLVIDLLPRPQAPAPSVVPVLVPLNAWNPTEEGVEEFLVAHLAEEYPFLARRGHGASLAQRLLREHRVLPVLDGLDELAAPWHAAAVRRLDEAAGADRPLVLACRANEYETAITGRGTDEAVLAKAAVVEIDPVEPATAADFLARNRTRKPVRGRSGTPSEEAPERWRPVLEHLRAQQDAPGQSRSPLARVLSTPLMVSLARAAYRPVATRPADLLELPDQAAVRRTLIDAFTANAYRASPRPPSTGGRGSRGWRRAWRSRLARRWGEDPERSRKWLETIAYQLYQDGNRDFRWWRLDPEPLYPDEDRDFRWWRPAPGPRKTRITASTAAAAATAATTAAVAAVVSGIAVAAVAAVAAVMLLPLSSVLIRQPSHRDPLRTAPADEWPRARRADSRWVGVLLLGATTGTAVPGGWETLGAGLLYGVFAALVPSRLLTAPLRIRGTAAKRAGPRQGLRDLRRDAATAALRAGTVSGLLHAAAVWTATGSQEAVAAGCVAAVLCGLPAAHTLALRTWTRYQIVRLTLTRRGDLPLALWTFLDDAHQRGVLRQSGTLWQFRHALLQDHLADQLRVKRLRVLAAKGDRHATDQLVDLLVEQGRLDELRTLAEAGNGRAADRLAYLLVEQGRLDELHARADNGDWQAADRLADLLAEQVPYDGPGIVRPYTDRRSLRISTRFAIWRLDHSFDTISRPYARKGDWRAASRSADQLVEQGRVDVLQALAGSGDWRAAVRLTDLLLKQKRLSDAITVLRPYVGRADGLTLKEWIDFLYEQGCADELSALVDNGDRTAAARLADLLIEQGRVDDAITILRLQADDGNKFAAACLLDLLVDRGRVDELRARADSGDWRAARRLAHLLVDRGRVDELRARADSGDREAAACLVDLLIEQGCFDEIRARADSGDWGTAVRLVDLLVDQGHADGAITVLRSYADGGNRRAAVRLADLLVAQEHFGELRSRADKGDWQAATRLVDILVRQGRVDDAILVVRSYSNSGNRRATSWMAKLRIERERLDELRARAVKGDWRAARQWTDILVAQGRVDDAVSVLRPYANRGEEPATRRMVDLLGKRGRLDEAAALLRPRADKGDGWAAVRLAELLERRGNLGDALALLRPRADKGDEKAATGLVELLERQGRLDDAAAFLRPRAASGNEWAVKRLARLMAERSHRDPVAPPPADPPDGPRPRPPAL